MGWGGVREISSCIYDTGGFDTLSHITRPGSARPARPEPELSSGAGSLEARTLERSPPCRTEPPTLLPSELKLRKFLLQRKNLATLWPPVNSCSSVRAERLLVRAWKVRHKEGRRVRRVCLSNFVRRFGSLLCCVHTEGHPDVRATCRGIRAGGGGCLWDSRLSITNGRNPVHAYDPTRGAASGKDEKKEHVH